jgi:undecaprenyl diphosphate synthase
VDALRRCIRVVRDLGIPFFTVYSFSSENWTRPRDEVGFLMGLLRRFIRQDVAELHAENVRIRVIGERAGIDDDLVQLLAESEALTAANTGLTFIIAFNSGARQELAAAARRLAAQVAAGQLRAEEITPERLAASLYTAGIPDPDLLIRTSGEERLSNFLLWQCAYTEFVFVPEHWPDFTAEVLARAISTYQSRDRRFGGLTSAGGRGDGG